MAYLWALFYEEGFLKYFSIPYYFISLNPSTVLSTNASLFIAFGVLFAIGFIIIKLPEKYYLKVAVILFIIALFFCFVCR